jgi:acetyl esterase
MWMLEPGTKDLLDMFRGVAGPKMRDLSPAEARVMYREMVNELDRPAEAVSHIAAVEIDAGSHRIPARLFVPDGADEGPLLLYFHGGGWVIGDIETHEGFCTSFANQIGLRLLAINYRLAPEATFPAAHHDCLFAARWAAASADELGAPIEAIAVAGDSAGANMAAFVASELRRSSGTDVVAQLLFYPVTDLTRQAPSYRLFGEGHLLDASDMEWFSDHYFSDRGDRGDPRVSILHRSDLSDMPPTVLMTCSHDPLRDEGRAFAARLVKAGVHTVFREARGHVHGIVSMRGAIPAADRIIRECVEDFRRLLAARASGTGMKQEEC